MRSIPKTLYQVDYHSHMCRKKNCRIVATATMNCGMIMNNGTHAQGSFEQLSVGFSSGCLRFIFKYTLSFLYILFSVIQDAAQQLLICNLILVVVQHLLSLIYQLLYINFSVIKDAAQQLLICNLILVVVQHLLSLVYQLFCD